MANNTPRTVALTYTYSASPSEVFAAWTQAERLASWWGGPGFSTPSDLVSVDATVGGEWSVTMVSEADGTAIPFVGSFSVFDAPSKLVITLRDEPSPDAEVHSEMVVELTPVASGTELHFEHNGFGSEQSFAELEGGYVGFFFPGLAGYLDGAGS